LSGTTRQTIGQPAIPSTDLFQARQVRDAIASDALPSFAAGSMGAEIVDDVSSIFSGNIERSEQYLASRLNRERS